MKDKKQIIESIIYTGFDGWWEHIDEDIQEEIVRNLENILSKHKSGQRELLKTFIEKEVDPCYEIDTGYKFGIDTVDDFINTFNNQTIENENKNKQ